MNKQTQLLQNSLPLIAAGLGDKLGIRVTVNGDQAWTDGTTINIPDFKVTSKEQKDAVLGFVCHEAGHLKFNSLTESVKKRLSSVAIKNCWNIFEDLRIEMAMIERMVGTKKWLNQIWINIQNEGNRPVIDDKAPPAKILFEYLLFACRVHHRNQHHLMPYLDAAKDLFCRTFGCRLMAELDEVIDKKPSKLSSSEDALELALHVLSMIKNHEPAQEKKDESKPGSSNKTSRKESEGMSGDTPSDDKVKAAIQDALSSSKVFNEMDDFAETMGTLAKANPESSNVAIPDVKQIDRSSRNRVLSAIVRGTSTQLTAKLQAIVEEEMRVKRKTKTSGRSLNSKVLHRYVVNDARLFKYKTQKRQIDTVVEICIDNSSSMVASSNYLAIAKEAQMALALALERINGVSITASAFPTERESEVFALLKEGERAISLSQRYQAINGQGYNTPTASAMWHCIRSVLGSQRSNKVIIMITDGYPNRNQREALVKLVQQAKRSGITVIGVAIGAIARKKTEFYQYFPNALFIQNIAELKSELFKVARDILVY